jgi:phage terminase small subunit
MKALTARQRRFVSEYLVDNNATKAAIRAGYAPIAARITASRLLDKPHVVAALNQRTAALLQKVELEAADLLRANAEIVQFDPAELLDDAGNYKPLRDVPAAVRRCIRRIRVHKVNLTTGDGKVDTVVDYEVFDKHPALDRDYKRIGLLRDRIDVRVSLESLVVASNKLLDS